MLLLVKTDERIKGLHECSDLSAVRELSFMVLCFGFWDLNKELKNQIKSQPAGRNPLVLLCLIFISLDKSKDQNQSRQFAYCRTPYFCCRTKVWRLAVRKLPVLVLIFECI